MRKTTQAIKISAAWTPNAEAAADMALSAFGDVGPASKLCIAGGRIMLRHAIKANMRDPETMVRVSRRVAAIEKELLACGTLHSFTATAGSAPVDEVEELATEATEKDAA